MPIRFLQSKKSCIWFFEQCLSHWCPCANNEPKINFCGFNQKQPLHFGKKSNWLTNQSSLLFVRETYQTKSTITDDLWFKPLPLPTITGVEIYTSQKWSTSIRANRVAPYWFYSLLLGFFSFSISLVGIGVSLDSSSTSDESNSFLLIVLPAILGIIFLLASLYLYSAKAKVKLYNSINSVTKSRTINIGAYDNIQNCPTHITLEIEDSQPLASIFQWCKELQTNCPHLNGEDDPLILM